MKQQGAVVTGNKRSLPTTPDSDRINKLNNSMEKISIKY
jgi:hypothetical protein